MNPELWGNLPPDLIERIAHFADIDSRRALGFFAAEASTLGTRSGGASDWPRGQEIPRGEAWSGSGTERAFTSDFGSSSEPRNHGWTPALTRCRKQHARDVEPQRQRKDQPVQDAREHQSALDASAEECTAGNVRKSGYEHYPSVGTSSIGPKKVLTCHRDEVRVFIR